MDETWTLVALSFAMFIGSYISGIFPLSVSLSESKLRLVSIFGAGLLVGTALAVIIPEGVHALNYKPTLNKHYIINHEKVSKEPIIINKADNINNNNNNNLKILLDEVDKKINNHHHGDQGEEPKHGEFHDHDNTHNYIGVAMVFGFVFMLLVDQIGGHFSGNDKRGSFTATLGLVVHAAADGVALGAAASTSHTKVEIIIFIAIMLHKAPASFGLVSFLLHEGMERGRIRKHLIIFSASAPIFALITYFFIAQKNKDELYNMNGTGITMLFSGGTFLYVATVHILPEIAQNKDFNIITPLTTHNQSITPNITIETGQEMPNDVTIHRHHHHHGGFNKLELIILVFGCLFPTIIAVGHQH